MNSKEIKEIKRHLYDSKDWLDVNSNDRKLYEEMSLREMIMSCLVYNEDIFTSINWNGASEYYGQPYVNEYIDILGKDRVMAIYNDQKNYFETKCKVKRNVYQDSEGLTYNTLIENID